VPLGREGQVFFISPIGERPMRIWRKEVRVVLHPRLLFDIWSLEFVWCLFLVIWIYFGFVLMILDIIRGRGNVLNTGNATSTFHCACHRVILECDRLISRAASPISVTLFLALPCNVSTGLPSGADKISMSVIVWSYKRAPL